MEHADEVIRYCPHCGNTAPQKLAMTHEYTDNDIFEPDGSRMDFFIDGVYEVRICATCNNLLLYDETDLSALELVYPKGHVLPVTVPVAVRQCYEEAQKVRLISPSAYAVLLRRALETICDDRGVKLGLLHRRLAELADRGEIPPVLSEATSLLRTIGNAGAHSGGEVVTIPMTWGMSELFRAVVEYVYVAPSRVAEFRKSTKRRDEAIQKRDRSKQSS